jgi:hypothetical protein
VLERLELKPRERGMGEGDEWCHAVGERTEWGAVGRQGTRPAEVSGGSAALLHAEAGEGTR